MTRHLSPDSYGLVTAFTLAMSILGALTGLSVNGAVSIRYFQQDRYDLPRYVGACLQILAGTSLASVSCVTLLGPLFVQYTGLHVGWLITAVLASAAQFIIQIQLTLWQSAGQPLRFGALRILQTLTDALVTLALVVGLGWAWEGRLVGIVVGCGLTALVAMLLMLQRHQVRFQGATAYVGDALRYGTPLVAHVLGGLLITAGDKIIVGSTLSLADLGQYAVAGQVAMILTVLFDAVFKAFHPWVIANSLNPELRVQVVRATYRLLAGTTLAAAAFYAIAMVGFELFVGSHYAAGRDLLLPLTIAAMFRCGYFATAIFINIADKNRYLAANSLLSGVLGVATAAALTSVIGVKGAAYGVLVSEMLSFALNLRCSIKVFPMPWIAAWKAGR
ncbi:oligosaccharide flippase family protein [Pelomonas sp. P7]|uniref:Oligosaccharide flippase family protein n=2 Tax=Pelomonas caseinilytica TaxID=2906763 RepID=A0ABS8XH56_9BURK|nr:oligosaccharide flippase family protein [Pelomonas sp. P7]